MKFNKSFLVLLIFLTGFSTKPLNEVATNERDIESIPRDLKKFYNSLSIEEKEQLTDIAKKIYNGSLEFSLTDNSFIDNVKEQSGDLAIKVLGIRDMINAKLGNFQPESRNFVEDVLRKFIGIFADGGLVNILMNMKNFGSEVLQMYDTLADPIKQDIMKGFPTIGSIATSNIVRLILNKLASYDPSAPNLVLSTEKPKPIIDEATKSPFHIAGVKTSSIYPTIPSSVGPGDDIEEPISKQVKVFYKNDT